MALALGSARLNVTAKCAPPPPVQHVKPARTSIAEDAIFIPKPHKRVDFKLNVGADLGGSPAGAGTGKPDAQPIPLPGQGADNGGGVMQAAGGVTVTGQNISTGSLGEHGLTAAFGKDSYMAPKQLVKTEYDPVPQKDFTAIATQEEGRQTNHAKQSNYTQQYDAYGRPRIGFSREPYDFAATKYVSKTSEIKFQENMQATRQAYGKYAKNDAPPETKDPPQSRDQNVPAPGAGNADSAKTGEQQGMIDPEAAKGPKGLIDPNTVPEKSIGAAPKEGMVDPNQAGAPGNTNAPGPNEALPQGETALTVAEKMGMVSDAVMTPTAAVGGRDAAASVAPAGKGGTPGGDPGLGGATAGEVAAMMNISAVLTASPEKVADFHASAPLMKSSAAISISA